MSTKWKLTEKYGVPKASLTIYSGCQKDLARLGSDSWPWLVPHGSWISGDINPTGLLNTIVYFVVILTEIISTALDTLGSHVADAYG